MLTRLKVSGFKNLIDLDVTFGTFTCLAGLNGVGKSNLFDAIQFLSAMVSPSTTLVDAARTVRDEGGSLRDLFHKVGDTYVDEMTFSAEMILPYTHDKKFDSLKSEFQPKSTYLRYTIVIRWNGEWDAFHPFQMMRERLEYASPDKKNIRAGLGFSMSDDWVESVIYQTDYETAPRFIEAHQTNVPPDLSAVPEDLRREAISTLSQRFYTILSNITHGDGETVQATQSEMMSWRIFTLDPTTMRKPSQFLGNNGQMRADGGNLPAVAYRLFAQSDDKGRISQTIANMLSELVSDIRQIRVDVNEQADTLTLMVQQRDGTWLSAKSLSDGTLRFLALAMMSIDPDMTGIICLEEPENGMHPDRIPALLDLLHAIACDPQFPVEPDNPLRQVIINTHLPALVMQLNPEDLLIATAVYGIDAQQRRYKKLLLSPVSSTWRTRPPFLFQPVTQHDLIAYLKPVQLHKSADGRPANPRLIDRSEIQSMFNAVPEAE